MKLPLSDEFGGLEIGTFEASYRRRSVPGQGDLATAPGLRV